MRGRAFVFGDDINTDMIINRKYYRGDKPVSETAKHVFEPIRPGFSENVEKGDIVVAGEHFGSGSSRPAQDYIAAAGVAAVVAESFSRIYYRNSIGAGMPAVISPGITDIVDDGDEIEIDRNRQMVVNHTTGEENPTDPYPDIAEKTKEAGGLFEYYKQSPEGI